MRLLQQNADIEVEQAAPLGNAPTVRQAAEVAARLAEAGRMTLGRLFELFVEYKAGNKSICDDKSRWRLYLEKDFSRKEVHEVVTLDVDRVRHRLTKKGLAPATVKQAVVLLKRVINHAVKKGIIPAFDPSRLQFEMPVVRNERTED